MVSIQAAARKPLLQFSYLMKKKLRKFQFKQQPESRCYQVMLDPIHRQLSFQFKQQPESRCYQKVEEKFLLICTVSIQAAARKPLLPW